MLTLENFHEIAQGSPDALIVARKDEDGQETLHVIKKGSRSMDGTLEIAPADAKGGEEARKILLQLLEKEFGQDVTAFALSEANRENLYSHSDPAFEGRKITAVYKYAKDKAAGIKAATGSTTPEETLKMNKELLLYIENYKKTTETLQDPLFKKYRDNEEGHYWRKAMESVAADRKEEAVVYKQAAETMDKCLSLKKKRDLLCEEKESWFLSRAEGCLLASVKATIRKIALIKELANEAPDSEVAAELQAAINTIDEITALAHRAAKLCEQGTKNEYGQDASSVASAQGDLLKSLETTIRKIALIKKLANEAPDSEVAAELQEAISLTKRTIAFYDQSAEFCEQGTKNRYGQNYAGVRHAADSLLKSVETTIRKIALIKELANEAPDSEVAAELQEAIDLTEHAIVLYKKAAESSEQGIENEHGQIDESLARAGIFLSESVEAIIDYKIGLVKDLKNLKNDLKNEPSDSEVILELEQTIATVNLAIAFYYRAAELYERGPTDEDEHNVEAITRVDAARAHLKSIPVRIFRIELIKELQNLIDKAPDSEASLNQLQEAIYLTEQAITRYDQAAELYEKRETNEHGQDGLSLSGVADVAFQNAHGLVKDIISIKSNLVTEALKKYPQNIVMNFR